MTDPRVSRRKVLQSIGGAAALAGVTAQATTAQPDNDDEGVAEGLTIYIGDAGPMRAVDAETGARVWSFIADSEETEASNWMEASPIVVDGVLYFSTESLPGDTPPPKLYAVDAKTGEEIWSKTGWYQSSPTVVDGTIYIGRSDDHLYALDAASGEEQWSFETGSWIWSGPNVVEGTAYIGSWDEHVYAVDAETGTEEWAFETNGEILGSPTAFDGMVYVGSTDGTLYTLDTDGIEQWRLESGDEIRGDPVVADGIVYLKVRNGTLYALAADTGEEVWTYEEVGGYGTNASPAVHDGTVYAGATEALDDDGAVLDALDANTGTREWRAFDGELIQGGVISQPPNVVEETVYTQLSNRVVALEADTGDMKWISEPFNPIDSLQTAPTIVADPEHGNSIGSRVRHGTLGHNELWTGVKPSVADYANEDGIVDASGLNQAFIDWQAGEIDASLLADVFSAWQDGEPVA